MTVIEPKAVVPQRAPYLVKARRITFPFGATTPTRRHFADGDAVLSHFVAVLSASFPAGEDMFVRSVRAYADKIKDPVLKKQVAGFAGQELIHGQQHHVLNQQLAEMGYPTTFIEKQGEKGLLFFEKLTPKIVSLAMTAAAEHYTATLAERILRSKEIQDLVYDPEVKDLFLWHTFEELEHKSVAFDVYRYVGGNETIRIGAMAIMLPFSFLYGLFGTLASMATDPGARNPVRAIRQTVKLFRGPLFRGIVPELALYLKPGFHPNDVYTDDMLDHWQTELFGPGGRLVDHLK